MENMAAMLSEVAGGLQQSFGTVFERVGQSLEQSAQMMQMMNGMMEAALLQNLGVSYTVDVAPGQDEAVCPQYVVVISVENKSRIVLSEVVVNLLLGADDLEKLAHTQEQGIDASSTVHVVIALPSVRVGHQGSIQVDVRSPGTQQWISKDVPFRIPVLKMANIQSVLLPLPSTTPTKLVDAQSDRVSVAALRDALGVSAFDALLTASHGYYHVSLPAGILSATDPVVFQLSIHQTSESTSGSVVVVSTESSGGAAEEKEHLQQQCHALVEELESL